jgi:ankyrin repeat protein
MTQELFLEKYQIHFLIFNNQFDKLEEVLQSELEPITTVPLLSKNLKETCKLSHKKDDLFSFKFRGQTPLTLAITLNRIECVKLLLKYGAKTLEKNELGWSAWHESISYGDRAMIEVFACTY